MIPSLKAPRQWRATQPVWREPDGSSDTTSTNLETGRTWWLRVASILAAAYLVASQALVEIGGWSSVAFALVVLLTGVLAAGSFYGAWKLRLGGWVFVPLLFLSYCLLRCFSGIKDTSSLNVFAQLASAFLGGIAVAVAFQAGVRFAWLVYAQMFSGLLQIVIVLCGLGPEPPPGDESFRYAGITGNANLLALQLTLGACLIWLLPRKAGLWPCVFACGAVAFAVAVTGSRKAILIASFFLVLTLIQVVPILPKKRRKLTLGLVIAVLGLTGLSLGQWIYQNGAEILAVQRTLDFEDSSYRTRAEMVQQGLQLWRHSPLFGNGVDAFRGLSGQGTYAHNNYVELLCDIGLIGTLLFYAIYAQVLIRAAQAPRLLRLYCQIFILMLLLADFGYVSYTSKQSVMILMILTVVTTSHDAIRHRRHSQKHGGALHKSHKPRPRRFVMGT